MSDEYVEPEFKQLEFEDDDDKRAFLERALRYNEFEISFDGSGEVEFLHRFDTLTLLNDLLGEHDSVKDWMQDWLS